MTQVPIALGRHAVRFFENDESAHCTITEYFSDDARPDDFCILISRVETFAGVRRVMAANPATGASADRIQFVAADESQLAQFLTGDVLDRERAEAFFLEVLAHVPKSSDSARVRLYGEMADVLCERGQPAIALQMEDVAGVLFAVEPRLSILCGYRIRHLTGDSGAGVLRAVCGKHDDVGSLLAVSASADTCGGEPAPPGAAGTTDASLRVVYVVDDDASMRRSLGRLLTVSNFQVCAFDSAEAFLKEATAFSNGCLLLDMQLGGMSGLELIARLAERGFRLPIIAMTGFRDEKTESEALRLGACAFLHKPFEPKLLLEVIERGMRDMS